MKLKFLTIGRTNNVYYQIDFEAKGLSFRFIVQNKEVLLLETTPKNKNEQKIGYHFYLANGNVKKPFISKGIDGSIVLYDPLDETQ